MNSYQKELQPKKWFLWIVTFVVAISSTYLAEVYFANIFERGEKNEAKRLMVQAEESFQQQEKLKSTQMIKEAMQSVVGISKLQANEESIFDVSVAQKWGLRNRNHCDIRWLCTY